MHVSDPLLDMPVTRPACGLAQDSFRHMGINNYSLAEGRPPMTVTLQVALGERTYYPAQLIIINDVDF